MIDFPPSRQLSWLDQQYNFLARGRSGSSLLSLIDSRHRFSFTVTLTSLTITSSTFGKLDRKYFSVARRQCGRTTFHNMTSQIDGLIRTYCSYVMHVSYVSLIAVKLLASFRSHVMANDRTGRCSGFMQGNGSDVTDKIPGPSSV